MNGDAADPKARARNLMMSALDGELPAAERNELDRLLSADAELREEWEKMRRVKQVTETMGLRQPPEEVWEDFWRSSYARVERGLGWILASLSALVLLGYGAWKWIETLLADAAVPGFLKVALFGLVLGFLVVVISVVREKMFTARRDPYKEIQR